MPRGVATRGIPVADCVSVPAVTAQRLNVFLGAQLLNNLASSLAHIPNSDCVFVLGASS